MIRVDYTGKVFGRLTVVEFSGELCRRNALWTCKCECGKTVKATSDNLKGTTRSCGCLRIDNNRAKATLKKANPAIYIVWCGMRQRCSNPKHVSYKDYGGRGIQVCERWRTFDNFMNDMGPRPTPKHTIERSDNEKGYIPGNCYWATRDVQAKNRRKGKLAA
jgi:hypothetical protein